MGQPVSFSTLRAAARLANNFVLDMAKLGGLGRDVVDGLLLCAISQANVAQITRSPELSRAYATLSQSPPDEFRRPVSVNAIATSLHIPFETARRRIVALAELGTVRLTPKGAIIPTAPLTSPLYAMTVDANYQLVRTLYARLRSLGMLARLPQGPGGRFDPADPPYRLVARISSDYLLRLAEPLTEHVGDLVNGLVLMDMIQANTEHLADSDGGDDRPGIEGFLPDERRAPVRATTLGQRLGIPPETVRRHVRRLVQAELCDRVRDGYIVPRRVLARSPFTEFVQGNQVHVQRMFAGLADAGVIALWDEERSALRGAA